jgi:hypothetical protein
MSWKDIVKSVAPVLGTALGGPFGGAAAKFIGDKILGNPVASEADISDYIVGASPDQLAAIKKADHDFDVQMKGLDVDILKIEAESITTRHKTDMSSDSWLSKNVRPMALVFLTVTTVILAYFSVFSDLTELQIRTLDMWLGLLLPLLLTCYGFYFGGRSLEKVKLAKK